MQDLARPERLELPTPRFVVWCSIQLSYGRGVRGLAEPSLGGKVALGSAGAAFHCRQHRVAHRRGAQPGTAGSRDVGGTGA